jgi:hypothetical protein
VPVRIDVALRIVEDVGVAIEILRIVGFLDIGVGRDKAANLLIIVPPAVVIEPALGIEFLAGKAVGRIEVARVSRRFRFICVSLSAAVPE